MMEVGPIPVDDFESRVKRKARFERTSTTKILATEYQPLSWVVRGYVCEGLVILAGRRKLGKTWLAIDWAIAVACGDFAMGSIPCEQGDVLYIDMENGHRRIKRRIETLFPHGSNRPDLSRLEWVSEAPMLNKGFIDALDDWRLSVPKPRLVIIDVLQRIKPAGNANQNAYESDYSMMAALQQWATTHGIAVIALHHTRKGGADDPLEALSGSNGLSACADTTLVLNRDKNGITLYVRGRDVEEKESAMKFTAGFWSIVGEAAKVRLTNERREILEVLENSGDVMSPSEVAGALAKPVGNIKKLLFEMAKAGEVEKEGRGRYRCPQHEATGPPNGGNLGNHGNLSEKSFSEQEVKECARGYHVNS